MFSLTVIILYDFYHCLTMMSFYECYSTCIFFLQVCILLNAGLSICTQTHTQISFTFPNNINFSVEARWQWSTCTPSWSLGVTKCRNCLLSIPSKACTVDHWAFLLRINIPGTWSDLNYNYTCVSVGTDIPEQNNHAFILLPSSSLSWLTWN